MLEKINELEILLQKYNKIYILRHQNPDLDAIGSQMGVREIIKEKFPQKEVYAYCNDDPEEFNYIGESDVNNIQEIRNSLVFIVDTANVDRIEGDYKFLISQNNQNKIIKIDHHPNLEPFGHINLVVEGLSSTSELIYEIFINNLQYKLNNVSAKALFSGIYSDTGGFSYSSTTSRTFYVASELVKFDFYFEELMLNIKELDYEIVKILGWMYSNINIENNLGTILITNEVIKQNNLNKKKISQLVNYMGIIKGLNAWLLFVDHNSFIRVNMRSKKDIDVSKIANQYDGGGHKNASGAKVKDWKEAEELITKVKEIM